MSNFEVRVTVKGGFPVIVRGHLHPAEPDVGIMAPYIDDFEVLTLKRKPCPWLKLDDEQEEEMLNDVWFSLHGIKSYFGD